LSAKNDFLDKELSFCDLRRSLGDSYLSTLQFFLNHRCLMRSQVPEQVGKSPKQLLTGEAHPHWLELLGFKRFQRA
jgi:hypothetical protein